MQLIVKKVSMTETYKPNVTEDKFARPVKPRKIRRKPLRISYEEFRNDSSENSCCGGDGGATLELAVLLAREITEAKPAIALDELFIGKEGVEINGVWHHPLVAEVLLVCLRNAGYDITEDIIDEAIDRGRQLPGGTCGFLGVCGALTGAAAAYAILLGSTPVAGEARKKALAFAGKLHTHLAEIGGSRCCKKSSYVAIELAQEEFVRIGFELPKEEFRGRCRFFSLNETCDGASCVYFPRRS
jgi:hypothetical protein